MSPLLPTIGLALLPYLILFVLMVVGNAYVVLRLFGPSGPPTLATITFLLGILLMSAGLWGALLYALLSPGDASTTSVFIAMNSMMAVVGCWAISLFFRAEERRAAPGSLLWSGLFTLLVVGTELLMGSVFVLGTSGAVATTLASAPGGAGGLVLEGTLSLWFPLAMVVNMLVALSRVGVPPAERLLLLLFAVAVLPLPWVLSDPALAAAAAAVPMGAAVALTVATVRTGATTDAFGRLAIWVFAGFALMGACAGWLALDPGALAALAALSLVVVLSMGAEFLAVARWGLGASRTPGTMVSQAPEVPSTSPAPSPGP